MKGIVVVGIGTNVGKTIFSAIASESLKADYWKPIQAGSLEATDSDFVKKMISNKNSKIIPEAFRLGQPMSPHAAAMLDNVEIKIDQIQTPKSENIIVIELAGGLMAPLNNHELNIHLLKQWQLPVILVSQNYLGSINHTLLSFSFLKQFQINIMGVVFNGETVPTTESFILQYTGLNCLLRIKQENNITKSMILKYANELTNNLKPIL